MQRTLYGNKERHDGMNPDGQEALIHILLHLSFFILTWWCLQAFRFDVFIRRPESLKGRLLIILFAIAISYSVSSFFIDYFDFSLYLRYLFFTLLA
ncbi:DUF1146 family protein [Marinococcus sp. PL1-022]|nr:DUF1146 family protein [Marinococcus sp. PL1-022]MDX6154097.1 DUF1146 family protein [Marinococcus sp. PL1-022]